MTAQNTQIALFSIPGLSIDSQGGIKALNAAEDNFLCADNVLDMFVVLNITDRASFWKSYFIASMTLKKETLKHFLLEGYKLRYCNFEDLKNLYLLQNKEKRSDQSSFTLDSLSFVVFQSTNFKEDDAKSTLVLNYREWIISIANQVVSINPSDMYLFFQQWFYRDEKVSDVFSEEFYNYWYSKTVNTFPDISGKIASLFLIAYQRKFPDKDIFSDIFSVNKNLIRKDYESHGIYRNFSLLYMLAKGDKKKIRQISILWCEIINTLLRKGETFKVGLPTSIVMEDPGIPISEKKFIFSHVLKCCTEINSSLSNFRTGIESGLKNLSK